jgi:hypothetical protein
MAKFEWWHLIVVIVAIFVIIQFMPSGTQSVFNIGSVGDEGVYTSECKATYHPTWDGLGVGCGVGKGGWGSSTPVSTIEEYMAPLRVAYNNYLNQQNIKVGNKCYIDVTATKATAANPNSQQPYTEAEYGGTHLNLSGTIVATNNGLLSYNGEYTNYNRYFYWEDYKCVLDTPKVFNNVGDTRWIYVEATLQPTPVPCVGAGCNPECPSGQVKCACGGECMASQNDCPIGCNTPNPSNWFTDDSIIAGIPNWCILVAVLILIMVMFKLI